MTGTTAVAVELASVAVPMLFVLAVLATWSRRPGTAGLVTLAIVLVMFAVMSARLINECRGHWFLGHLGADRVRALRVGRYSTQDPLAIGIVVNALHGCRWFTPTHGGWSREVPFEVTIGGSTQRMAAAFYLRDRGAIIGFVTGNPVGAHAQNGYAYCPELAEALDTVGMFLPRPLD